MLKDVTADLNGILAAHAEVQAALSFIIASPLLGRETLSAVLGEVSEHVIARFIGGAREARGNNGYDLRGPANEKIEVKARQLSRYGANLKFDPLCRPASSGVQAGDRAIPAFQSGVLCCSIYCRMMDRGAPPHEAAK